MKNLTSKLTRRLSPPNRLLVGQLQRIWNEWKLYQRATKAMVKIEELVRTDPLLVQLGVEFVPEDARVFVKELSGVRSFWVARGGYIEANSIRAEVMEIQRDTVGSHIYEHESKLRLPDTAEEKWSEIETLAAARIRNEILERVFNLFMIAAHHHTADGETARDMVADAGSWGSPLVVGRLKNFSQVLSRFGIADRVHLNNVRDNEDTKPIPEDRIAIVSPSAYRFAVWGSPLFKFYCDDNWYAHLIMRWDFGGVVYHSDQLAVVMTPEALAERQAKIVAEEAAKAEAMAEHEAKSLTELDS